MTASSSRSGAAHRTFPHWCSPPWEWSTATSGRATVRAPGVLQRPARGRSNRGERARRPLLTTWSLILVVSVKYLGLILRADNQGEGGILALMALAVPPATERRGSYTLLLLGLFGAALLYGDGMITPAISVLSAIEGLTVATPVFEPYVIPLTVPFSSVSSHCSAGALVP